MTTRHGDRATEADGAEELGSRAAGATRSVAPAQQPTSPSRSSRMRSAWPLWRAYSSTMCV